jgi:hypothetical protein
MDNFGLRESPIPPWESTDFQHELSSCFARYALPGLALEARILGLLLLLAATVESGGATEMIPAIYVGTDCVRDTRF